MEEPGTRRRAPCGGDDPQACTAPSSAGSAPSGGCITSSAPSCTRATLRSSAPPNAVVAVVLAVLKGSAVMIEWLARDEVAFQRLRDWIEETEALLAVGVIGRDRREVGLLVEVAFRKYNEGFGQLYGIMSSSDVTGGGAGGRGAAARGRDGRGEAVVRWPLSPFIGSGSGISHVYLCFSPSTKFGLLPVI